MRLIDFHTHVLPDMDDGARDASESVKILEALAAQGVGIVYATPHFYADMESVSDFAQRREKAYRELLKATEGRDDLPEVRLGAEIMICKELLGLDLSPLKFEDVPIMLFEFPVSRYHSWYASLAEKLAATYACTAMVAHFDRYPWLDKNALRTFTKYGDEMLFQMNCIGLTDIRAAKTLAALIKGGSAVIFGSDSHDSDAHAPSFNVLTSALDGKGIKLDRLGLKRLKPEHLEAVIQSSQNAIYSLSGKNSHGLIG